MTKRWLFALSVFSNKLHQQTRCMDMQRSCITPAAHAFLHIEWRYILLSTFLNTIPHPRPPAAVHVSSDCLPKWSDWPLSEVILPGSLQAGWSPPDKPWISFSYFGTDMSPGPAALLQLVHHWPYQFLRGKEPNIPFGQFFDLYQLPKTCL